jgi:hypothetical protein
MKEEVGKLLRNGVVDRKKSKEISRNVAHIKE